MRSAIVDQRLSIAYAWNRSVFRPYAELIGCIACIKRCLPPGAEWWFR